MSLLLSTVVPALGDPRCEWPPAVYGHIINVPTHLNVKLPAIGGHLTNADADSHLLVVRTCYGAIQVLRNADGGGSDFLEKSVTKV